MSDEVPEADAQEQRVPASPAGYPDEERGIPLEASEADYLEQQRPLRSGPDGVLPAAAPEAPEADLLEQGTGPSADDDEEYPPPVPPAGGEGQ